MSDAANAPTAPLVADSSRSLPLFFASRYEVVSLLGQGGMGSVFRVRDRELGEDVALKVSRTTTLGCSTASAVK